MTGFESLANSAGLVPMKFVDDWYTPYLKDQIAGFPPDVAFRLYDEDHVAFPVDGEGKALSVPDTIQAEARLPPPSSLDIPEDWESRHHLSRIRLAKDIGGLSEFIPADQADEIIRAELNRRGKGTTNGHEV